MFKYIILCLILFKLSLSEYNLSFNNETFVSRYKRSSSSSAPGKKRSLVMIFDSTGSMSDELEQLRDGAIQITQSFDKLPKNPIENYVFVEFNDPEVKEPLITTDKNLLISEMKKIYVHGGGTLCAEECFQGIEKALKAANHESYAFVFTDAGSKGEERIPTIKKMLSTKNIQLNFFANVGHCAKLEEFDLYRELASYSNGMFYLISEREINKVFENFGSQIHDNRTVTASFGSATGGTATQKVAVDPTMKEFTLTFIGQKPSVTIINPNNVAITNYTTLTDLDNVKVIQVNQPMPGAWKIEVSSTSAFSGQVSVLSDLVFYYGFSVNLPLTIQNTYYQPLLGSQNILSVSTSDDSLIGNLDSVKIASADGTSEFDLVLNKRTISSDNIIYSTDPFDIPAKGFKIHLEGKDVGKHSISRLLTPVIEASNPDPPSSLPNYDSIKVQEGEPILLFCQIKSAIPITMKWIRDSDKTVLTEIKANQSDLLKHIIDSAEITDAGAYVCIGENSLGSSESKTVVEVRSAPLTVITPNKTVFANENSPTTILKCVVLPKRNVKVEWLYNGSDILPIGSTLDSPNLIINNVKRDFSGTYKCVGTKNTDSQSDTIDLDVRYSPEIKGIIKTDDASTQTILKSDLSINVFKTKTLTLTCDVSGNPEPEIIWLKDTVEISTDQKINIDPIKKSSSGQYTCLAKNVVANDRQKIKVNVILAPTILSYIQNQKVVLDSKFHLSCPVVKNDAIIIWTFNNKPLNANYIKNDELTIDSADISMQGIYKCKAENLAGTVEAEFNLDILYPPSKPIFTKFEDASPTIIGLTENKIDIVNITTFSILCESKANPAPTITWKRNGVQFSTGNRLEINTNDLKLSGIYTCLSYNHLNSETRNIELEIYLKPEIEHPYKNVVEVIDGKLALVKCPIRGHKIEYSWIHNNTRKIPSSLIKNHMLSLAKVEKSDKGIWKCIGQNLAGAEEVYIKFDVLYPPLELDVTWTYISDIVDKKLPVMKGNILDITCTSDANPTPEISWYKDGLLVEETNNFVINSVLFDHAGKYKCEAKNNLGKISEIYELIVNAKPEFNSRGYEIADHHKSAIDPNMMCVLDAINLPPSYYTADYQITLNIPVRSLVKLNCMMTGFPEPSLEWWKNDKKISNSKQIIIMRNASIEDSGIYKCKRKNEFGEISVLHYVNMKKPTEAIYDGNTDVDVIYKRPITLTCKSKGNFIPFLEWNIGGDIKISTSEIFKNADQLLKYRLLEAKEKIYFDTNNNIVEDKDLSHLEEYGITSFEFENGEFIGRLDYVVKSYQYTSDKKASCFVNNEDPSNIKVVVRRGLKLHFKELPYYDTKLYSDYQEIERMANAPFSIKCPMFGTPAPEIKWYKDGVIIDFNAMPNLKASSNRKILDFAEPQEGQTGIYKCIGKNYHGETEMVYDIKISAKSTFDITDVDLNHNVKIVKEIRKLEKLKLDCSTKRKDKEFYWSKLFEVFPKRFQEHILYSNYYEVVGDENEVIFCSQKKEVDAYGVIYEIKVLEAPLITTTNKETTINVTDPLDLDCLVRGQPKPTVEWEKFDGVQFVKVDNSFLRSGTNLKKSVSTELDNGIYKCKATNKMGIDENEYVVNVKIIYEWRDWVKSRSPCSVTCGIGTQKYSRTCYRKDTGEISSEDKCEGSSEKLEKCQPKPCPINGGWSKWSAWTPCDKTCVKEILNEKSIQKRFRNCNNPVPKFGGRHCPDSREDTKPCIVPYCPQDGKWTVFANGTCSTTCGDGIVEQFRKCIPPKHGGKNCDGGPTQFIPCNNQPCCSTGLIYDKNTANCEDIDECVASRACHPSQTCVNTFGSFACKCRNGFETILKSTPPSKSNRCIDINECLKRNICGPNASCSNTPGSFTCYCNQYARKYSDRPGCYYP